MSAEWQGPVRGCNLSLDLFVDLHGKEWSAVIREHPWPGGLGVVVWQRHGMRTQYNAETAAEAAWQRLQAEAHNERRN